MVECLEAYNIVGSVWCVFVYYYCILLLYTQAVCMCDCKVMFGVCMSLMEHDVINI